MYCQYLLKCVFTAQKPAFMIEDKKQDGIKYLASREHAVLINIFVEYRIDKIGPPQTVNPGISEKKNNLDKSTKQPMLLWPKRYFPFSRETLQLLNV